MGAFGEMPILCRRLLNYPSVESKGLLKSRSKVVFQSGFVHPTKELPC